MTRRIFISYQHQDQLRAKGFNLLRWAKNVNFDFVGRHLLDPVKSQDPGYVTRKINEQLTGTSASVFLIGSKTATSDWVAKEIEWSKEKGNGLVGIKLEPGVQVPAELNEAGAEIVDWEVDQFAPAIERAIVGAQRGRKMAAATGSGGKC